MPPTMTLLEYLRTHGCHGRQAGVRRGGLRRLHGGPGGTRRPRQNHLPRHQQLHRASADVCRPGDRHRRGPRGRGHPAPRAGAHGAAVRVAVRLLHAGVRDVSLRGVLPPRLHVGPAAERPAQRQPLSMHRIPAHPRCGAGGARRAGFPPAAGPIRSQRACWRRASRSPPWTMRQAADGSSGRRPSKISSQPWRIRSRGPPCRGGHGNRRRHHEEVRTRSRSWSPPKAWPSSRGSREGPATWRIGGAATLTDIEDTVAPEYPSLAKMLRVFASRGIRSRATMGGNLATASPIGDSAPVLLTLDASLVLASLQGRTHRRPVRLLPGLPEDGAPARGDHQGDRAAAAAERRTGLTRRADFLKVSKRRELDISIVAGAFRVDLDARGIVRRARLAYGGVALTPRQGARRRGGAGGEGLGSCATEVVGAASRRVSAHRRCARQRRVPPRSRREPLGEVRRRRAEHRPGRRAGLRARGGVPRGRRLPRASSTRAAGATSPAAPCTWMTRRSAGRCSRRGRSAPRTRTRGSGGATRARRAPRRGSRPC